MASTFKLEEVTGGVWAAIAPGFSGPAVSNAAVFDLGDKTVVFDTFMTGAAAAELAVDATRLTGRDVSLVINSHWHSDHIRGNRAFGSVPIVGTRRMLELIMEDMPKSAEELHAAAQRIREVAKKRMAAAETDEDRATAHGTMALADAIRADGEAFNFALPDFLIEDRLEIEGERSLTILGFGLGHTESDLFAYLPEEQLVAAGDLVWNGVHPKTDDSFPADWVGVLNQMDNLGVSTVIPGHGDVTSGEQVGAMADYMRGIDETMAKLRAGETTVDEAEPPRDDWLGDARFRAGLQEMLAR